MKFQHRPHRRGLLVPLALLAALLPAPALFAQCPAFGPQVSNKLTQSFPPAGPAQTTWIVTYGHDLGKGLFITGASFQRAPGETFIPVIHDARLSDIFVPYHPGSPRYLDLSQFTFDLVPVAAVDLGPCGKQADPYVVKEVRDRGILWKNDQDGKRGYELVVWATLDADNYNYLIAYHFRDDGSIGFRVAATAVNLPGDELTAHMHNGLWRVDVDLGGAANDSVVLHSHDETIASTVASDSSIPFNGGKEGWADWSAPNFTMLNIFDTVKKNGQGKPISYDLMVPREGTPRHFEDFAHHDFWVTAFKAGERSYSEITQYVANQEAITNADIVLWYISPMHHMPRAEDGKFTGPFWSGVAHAMWTGFDLRPRNLFDSTPFYP